MKRYAMSVLLVGLALILGTSTNLLAKSDTADNGAYTEKDKEYYLTEAQIAFIRPGLELEIIDVVIPADLQPEVTFMITDPAGLPLDREGIFTPGPVSTSFILSFIPAGEEAYVAYTTRVATSPETGDSAVQASTDSGGIYTDMGDGVYLYKFATVLPADYDTNASHTLGMYARRDLREFDLDRYVKNALDHFIPSGEGVAVPRDIVTTVTCNRCHDPLALHGGSRQEVGLCVLCHNPTQSIDPDTGDSVDMPYMVHKIHAGVHLENGYTIIGYRQAVHDYSHVEFPAILNDCQVCHTGGIPTGDFPLVANPNPTPVCDGKGKGITNLSWGDEGKVEIRVDSEDGKMFAKSKGAGSKETGKWVKDGQAFFMVDAASGDVLQELPVNNTVFGCATNPPGTFRGEAGVQHTVWMTNPTRWVCGSCHDNIDWVSGDGHAGGPQADDNACSTCHEPTSGEEYDRSVTGAHTVEYKSVQLEGVLVQIIDIRDTDPGDRPTVTFSLSSKYGRLSPSELNRLRFSLNGPNTDFTFYVQETATSNSKPAGSNWEYRFEAKLPDDAMGSFTLGVEGRADAVINPGEDSEFETEDQIQNFAEGFAVTDTMPVDRRAIVNDAKCENCHANLSLHGGNRHDANGYCQTCHMPSATDAAVRPEGTGDPQSIDFRYMIHKIHRGLELENGYVVYGYRSSLHDFSEVEYPGDLRNCEACHDGGSYQLPLNSDLEPVTTPRDFWTPMLPETAACLSCHDGSSTAVHADSNTSDLGEACATCHGVGKSFSVDSVHAR